MVESNNKVNALAANSTVKGSHVSQVNIADVSPVPKTCLPALPSTALTAMNVPILERLARQVEYYFSDVNLEKDAYVSTLRSLNDGYVPLSIISNFGKVRMLVPHDSVNAIRRAATDYSELLEVVRVNSQTGKRVHDGEVPASLDTQTVEAVGPKSREPIPMSSIQAHPVSSCAPRSNTGAPVQNTVIIRDVPEGTADSHVRDLFTFEKCPPIQSLHLDVANCWFVTLATESKEDMINVMFELRSKRFQSGEPVKARLKSAVVQYADVSPFQLAHDASSTRFVQQLHGGNKKSGSKKKKNVSSKSKNNNNAQSKLARGGKDQHDSDSPHGNGNNVHKQKSKKSGSPRQDSRSKHTKGSKQTPPTLGEDQFPALPSDDLMNKNKFEVEKLPEQGLEDDDKEARRSSDSASTATTTSSSSSSKNTGSGQHAIGGYAAALLKPAPPVNTTTIEGPKPVSRTETNFVKKMDHNNFEKNPLRSHDRSLQNRSKELNKNENADEPVIKAQPLAWGGGRSFADVLRKEAGAASACQQSA